MTLTQRLVLDACTIHMQRHGVPPQRSTLAFQLYMSRNELRTHLYDLRREGYLIEESLEPTDYFEPLASIVRRAEQLVVHAAPDTLRHMG